LLVLVYFNWAGTSEEFKEFADRIKSIIDGTVGLELSGIFIPISEWHYTMVIKAASYEKVLQVNKTYVEKYGHTKVSLAKVELLHTFEEFGWVP